MHAASSRHPFDEAIALEAIGEDRWRGSTHPDYRNMVGPYGGITAAVALAAVLAHPQCQGDPVAQTVHFAAPVADGPFEMHARPIRTNRSSQHWLVEMRQGEVIPVFGTAVTALERDTWEATDAIFPQVPPASALASLDTNVLPLPWIQRYDMRFVRGMIGQDPDPAHPSESLLWVRDEPPRPLDFIALASLCDVFFPRLYLRRPRRVPIGTVTLTTYFHASEAMLAQVGDAHVLGIARGLHYGKGFFDQRAEIWSPEGKLLASSTQLVYFKE